MVSVSEGTRDDVLYHCLDRKCEIYTSMLSDHKPAVATQDMQLSFRACARIIAQYVLLRFQGMLFFHPGYTSIYASIYDMDIDIYERLIDEIAVENPEAWVWEIFFGDPFMCRDMAKRVRYAKDKGLKDVVLNSNGVKELWQQGPLKEYRTMHKEHKFDELLHMCRECLGWQSGYADFS